jgi:hypothetical protein
MNQSFPPRPAAAGDAAIGDSGDVMRHVLLSMLVVMPMVFPQPTPPVLSCQTMSDRMSKAELEQRFGDLDAAERQLALTWADADHTRLASITSVDRKSVWRTGSGVKAGLSITELDTLNGRAFQLRGFAHDDPGRVISWAGGKLEGGERGSCRMVVRLAPTVEEFTPVEWRLVEAILSTVEVTSDDRRLKPYRATVASVGLEWR